MTLPDTPLLDVAGLAVEFRTDVGPVHAVDGVSFSVGAGESVGLVGESGSGKTVTALSLAGLLDPGARVRGSVRLDGHELLGRGEAHLRAVRGRELAMVFQDPATSLDPVMDVVGQVAEMFRAHEGLGRAAARARAADTLRTVGLGDLAARYPHQLSGGMRQRVVLAMAVACAPRLIVADEPTTALDVTVQAQVLALLDDLVLRRGTSLLLISHDLGLIAGMTRRVLVMYAGRVVEAGPTDELFAAPRHPYTAGLLASVPRLDRPRAPRLATVAGQPPDSVGRPRGCAFAPRCPRASERCDAEVPPLRALSSGRLAACWHPLDGAAAGLVSAPPGVPPARPDGREPVVVARGVTVEIPLGRARVLRPVDGVDLTIAAGETLGLVGESGCGKSTLGRTLLMLQRPTAGHVAIAGQAWERMGGRPLRAARRHAQLVFQDPHDSFDPRRTVRAALAEPLVLYGVDAVAEGVDDLLERVHLDPWIGGKLPHECSGGQLQRVALARALAASPRFVVADEPTSALDVSIQAQVMNLMCDLQATSGLGYLFISHNLAVIRQIAHRVAVMYLGRIVELADSDVLFADPLHPYTQALISAVPRPDPAPERSRVRTVLAGDVPSLLHPPAGCPFHPRCPAAMDVCRTVAPPWAERAGRHGVACHLHPPT